MLLLVNRAPLDSLSLSSLIWRWDAEMGGLHQGVWRVVWEGDGEWEGDQEQLSPPWPLLLGWNNQSV